MQISVIFDMDGVIVDNGKFHYQSWKKFCDKYNISFSEDTFKNKFFGRTNEEVLPDLFGRELAHRKIKSFGEEKEKIYREIYKPHLQPVNGLLKLLRELKKKNIPVGVATSAPPENVEFIIEGLEIGGYIQTVVDDTMVTNGKPAPDIYLEAAKKLNSSTENCVVFEDSLSGTQSAYDAGAKVIALTTTLPAEKHKYAHQIIHDFTEISLNFILQFFFR